MPRILSIDVTPQFTAHSVVEVPISIPPGEERFDDGRFRLVELGPGGEELEEHVPFQFDLAPGFHSVTNPCGTLVFWLSPSARAGAARRFALRYEERVLVRTQNQVRLSLALDEGQECFEIATHPAVYLYQVRGAGFSSIVDRSGRDWLNYHPSGGADGKYRGIPNMGLGTAGFHPGSFNCTSRVVIDGPLKVLVESVSNDGLSAVNWEFFPTHARMTVLKAPMPYWFMYEGTPAGRAEFRRGYFYRSDGARRSLDEPWEERLPSPRWAAFGLERYPRSLLLYHHEEEDHGPVDSYRQMQNQMTVFGFGRSQLDKLLTRAPARFSLALVEASDFDGITRAAQPIVSPPAVHVGVWEE